MKTVLITGGTGGIGEGLVRAFTLDGWRVVFGFHHSQEKAARLAETAGAIPLAADLRDETQNLHVVVIPELNTTTLSLVTTAINPVVGIGTFLAQALFKGQITQAVTQEFEVTGSWSEPEVNKLARRASTERNAAEPSH